MTSKNIRDLIEIKLQRIRQAYQGMQKIPITRLKAREIEFGCDYPLLIELLLNPKVAILRGNHIFPQRGDCVQRYETDGYIGNSNLDKLTIETSTFPFLFNDTTATILDEDLLQETLRKATLSPSLRVTWMGDFKDWAKPGGELKSHCPNVALGYLRAVELSGERSFFGSGEVGGWDYCLFNNNVLEKYCKEHLEWATRLEAHQKEDTQPSTGSLEGSVKTIHERVDRALNEAERFLGEKRAGYVVINPLNNLQDYASHAGASISRILITAEAIQDFAIHKRRFDKRDK